MSVSERDRKVLWGRSGNRCAICRKLLVAEVREAGDRVSVLGQEAHIVARSRKGPRGRNRVRDDSHGNLILLCADHHKIVDDHPDAYPPDRLRRLKLEHEHWVATALERKRSRRRAATPLPKAPLRLVNREDELASLDRLMHRAADQQVPAVAVLSGMHGVGKSAVGAFWARQRAATFDDGHLAANLSRQPHGRPIDIAEVLHTFLRELGVGDDGMPAAFADRHDLYRRLTADRKLLVVLDDVEEPAHVLTVLPGGAGSVVVVTTNHHLEELLFEGAEAVPLDPLNPTTARRLLVALVGHDRVAAEPVATDELIELCGGLPIALCVCGGRLAGSGRGRDIAWLVRRITKAADPLDAMSGEGPFQLHAIFDCAYDGLTAQEARVYRRIAPYPGRDFTAAVAAQLTDLPLEEAESVLDRLVDRHLVEPHVSDRYRMHTVVRRHAAHRFELEEPAPLRHQLAVTLVDWYYATLRGADRAIFHTRLRLTDDVAVTARDVPTFATPAAVYAWFVAERENLVQVIELARDHELDERIWQMAEALWPLCYNFKSYELWVAAYEAGSAAAARLGNECAEARMRSALARAYSDLGDVARASTEMAAAAALVRRCGNDHLRASVAESDAIMRFERGDIDRALAGFEASRALFVGCGIERGVAIQDYQIGKCLLRLRQPGALAALDRALRVFERIGDGVLTSRVQLRRGEALSLSPDGLDAAEQALTEALRLSRELGLRFDEARTYEALASLADRDDRAQEAAAHRERAFETYLAIGHPRADAVLSAADSSGVA